MTPETARILALAIETRNEAAERLMRLSWITPDGMPEAAEIFIHEQRIINRIVAEERDGN